MKRNQSSLTAAGIAIMRALESEKPAEVSSMRRYRRLTGEGFAFGIPISSIQAFLEQRGFTQVRNADHAALEKAYYSGSQPRQVADGYAIASAVVSAS